MSNRIRLFVAACVAAAPLLVSQAATADTVYRQDDHHHCVTPAEFLKLHTGMTRLQVQGILDGPGSTLDEGTDKHYLVRRYPRCHLPWRQGRVSVLYFRDTNKMVDAFEIRYYGH